MQNKSANLKLSTIVIKCEIPKIVLYVQITYKEDSWAYVSEIFYVCLLQDTLTTTHRLGTYQQYLDQS